MLLFVCSLSKAVHLELTFSLATLELMKSFNKLIARRGKPRAIYFDNA